MKRKDQENVNLTSDSEEDFSTEDVIFASDEDPDDEEQESVEDDDDNAIIVHDDGADPSSEEEWDDPTRNTVGKIPMEYYDGYDHIGYNLYGQRIARSEQKDELEKYIEKEDNSDYWRTVRDVLRDKDITLSAEELQLVKSLIKGHLPSESTEEFPIVETDYPDKIHPLSNRPPAKSEFIPPKWEAALIRKLVKAIKKGWLKLDEDKPKETDQPKFYDIWSTADEAKSRRVLPAPKPKLPVHGESYNPPGEYLLNDEELEAWKLADPEDRQTNYIPQKYNTLRQVPAYKGLISERFERCLDLYLAPRKHRLPKKGPIVTDPELLKPALPPRESLKPFPSFQATVFKGHSGKVRSISVDPTGQWLVSGSEDCTSRLWEIHSGRCLKSWKFKETVFSVAWNPSSDKNVIAIATNRTLYLINPGLGDREQNDSVDHLLSLERYVAEEATVVWQKVSEPEFSSGLRIKIEHSEAIKQLSWHSKGDYLIALCPEASAKQALLIHQLSGLKSQSPFSKQKGQIQAARFHPSKPYLFVATRIHIKIYNLAKMQLDRKLLTGVQWISHFDIHPGGDNLVLGSYDKKMCWFDLDLSSKPFRTMKLHQMAIRKVAFHNRYPLFASCSDDLTVQVFHGMVYDDLNKNPLIVPLQVLKGHTLTEDLGILDCTFHPTQPWLFSAGSDSTIRMYS